MKALNLSVQSQHQEHQNSNYGFCPPSYGGIVGTAHALNVSAQNQNQENIDPYYGFCPPIGVCPPLREQPTQNSIFGASQDNEMITQLLKQMQTIQAQINGLQTNSRAGQNTGNQNKINNSDINPKTNSQWKRYCWSCGCCPHWGSNCPNKKKGHKDEATFKNRMSGSNQHCL